MSENILKVLIGICVVLIIFMSALIYVTRFYSQNKLSISSDVKNITLTLTDSKSLNELISSWGLFSKKIRLSSHTANPIQVSSVHIVLTPNIQQYDTHLGLDKKTVVQSSGHSFKDGVLTIFVYLDSDEVLSRDETEISQWILHTAILRIYSIAQNENINQNIFSKQVEQYYERASEIINVEKS